MPIDPNSLAAFAGTGGPPPGADESADADQGGGDEEEGPGQFGQLLTLLENNADDVMALTEEYDPDELSDESAELDDSEKKSMLEGVQSLDQALQGELGKLSGVSLDDAENMAQHLEGEGIIDDAERLGGWLFRVGQLDLSGDGSEEDDAEDEESEDSGDMGGDAADDGGDTGD